jgi:hypothetical protein
LKILNGEFSGEDIKELLKLLSTKPDMKAIIKILKILCKKSTETKIPETEIHFWVQNGLTTGGKDYTGTWLVACVKIEEPES